MEQPWQQRCTECERLTREFQDAWRSDQHNVRSHFHKTAEAAGREPKEFLHQWVMSLAQMPDDEFEALHWARYPTVAEVGRRWKAHAKQAGHLAVGDGWLGAFILNAAIRSGYYGLLSTRGDDPELPL